MEDLDATPNDKDRMVAIAKNNLHCKQENIFTYKGDGPARPIKNKFEEEIEDEVLAKCKQDKSRALVIFYGASHGCEDGGMMCFITNHKGENNLIKVESILRNVALVSDGLVYVIAIYDMCRIDLASTTGLSAGVTRDTAALKKINYYDLKGNTVKGKVDAVSNMLPLAFKCFD